MTNYMNPKKLRVQVMLTQDRYDQLQELAELTNSSVSRIVRLTLDGNADQLDQAIREQRKNGKNADFFEAKPRPKTGKTSKPVNPAKRPTVAKPITDESFANLVKKRNKR